MTCTHSSKTQGSLDRVLDVAPASLRWGGIVRNSFLISRLWFLTSLLIFMLSVAILPKTTQLESIWEVRVVIFFGRTFMYMVTMTRLLIRLSAAVIMPGYILLLEGVCSVSFGSCIVPCRMHLEVRQRLSPWQVVPCDMHSHSKVSAQRHGDGQLGVTAANLCLQ